MQRAVSWSVRHHPHRNHFRQQVLMTAPIVLFVFARPEHTRRTLEALAANPLAEQSDLIIYADAARKLEEIARVDEVRRLVRNISGFRSVSIIERETNYGLARNIIDGITTICNEYGRIIVLEDDIVTSPHFLSFMNTALDKYADEKRVWHISGWNYPINAEGLGDAFFWRLMNCWGWATWADRWQCFEKYPEKLVQTWVPKKIHRFNLDGAHNFWEQVELNYSGKLNTWAIFWYVTIFEHDGLCLNPVRSLVENIGHDGSGENCGNNDTFRVRLLPQSIKQLPVILNENQEALERIKKFYKNPHGLFTKLVRFTKKSLRFKFLINLSDRLFRQLT